MKLKVLMTLVHFDDLPIGIQWSHRKEIASDLFQKYRNRELDSIHLNAKIHCIAENDDVLLPIAEQIAHLNEVKNICRNYYYTEENGVRLESIDIEYIIA